MLAIDQRESIKKTLAKILYVNSDNVPHEAIAIVKKVIAEVLTPEATAVLIDPEYGFEGAWQAVPGNVGKLSTLEKSGGETVTINGIQEERTVLIDHWSVEQALQKGADAVKLLIPYHPKASAGTQKYQQSLVKQIGIECQELNIPFLVEFTSYPISSSSNQLKDEQLLIVAETARLFDQPDFGVTIHKVEFPGDIKFHAHQQLVESCRRVDQSVTKPWVLLSAGVEFDIFEKEVTIACENGASGFLAGRAIWQEAIGLYDSYDKGQLKMREWLRKTGVDRLRRLKKAGQGARPFTERVTSND